MVEDKLLLPTSTPSPPTPSPLKGLTSQIDFDQLRGELLVILKKLVVMITKFDLFGV